MWSVFLSVYRVHPPARRLRRTGNQTNTETLPSVIIINVWSFRANTYICMRDAVITFIVYRYFELLLRARNRLRILKFETSEPIMLYTKS